MKIQFQFLYKGIAFLLVPSVLVAALCGSLSAQTERTIAIRMLDSKTGRSITTSEFEVRVLREVGANRVEYVRTNKDGTGDWTISQEANSINVYARDGVWGYVNCDCVKDHQFVQHSYSVAEILRSGVVAPNRCNRKKAEAKPGELVFFVRPMTWWEKFQN